MQFVVGSSSDLPQHCVAELAQYRHRVFIERLGWDLQTLPGIELDDFDRQDTVYVIARGDHGRLVGCARLLPTTRPYLLSHVFPELLDGRPAPCSEQIWELSRFAALDLEDELASNFGTLSSPTAVALLKACIRSAYERGASELVTVSPLGVERLLRKAGFDARRWGKAHQVGPHWLFACRIAVSADPACSLQ